jgi:tripartite ATP-independent transporter DctM subunit
MSGPLLALFCLAGMFGLIALRVPIGAAMIVAGLIGFALLAGPMPAMSLLGTVPIDAMSSLDLAIVPLFLLMGALAGISGLSADVYRLAAALIGHRPGGLASATIIGCAGFGAVCGSSLATTATFGRIALPEMLARGYAPTLSTGSIAAGGTLGALVPPSVILVIYAILTEEFILDLFAAAAIPAVLATALYVASIAIRVRLNPAVAPAGARLSWAERWRMAGRSWEVLLLAFVVIGGIYGGIFTVNEAASIGVVMALAIALRRRSLTVTAVRRALVETASTTAMIYLIIIGATLFGYFISISRLPDLVIGGVAAMDLAPLVVIALLLVIYLVLGCVFDTVAALVITLPFSQPLIEAMGYDPIWWGIVLLSVVEIGMITPPIGMNVFVLKAVARDQPISVIFRGVLPFLGADAIRLALLVLLPALSLWLPSVLR